MVNNFNLQYNGLSLNLSSQYRVLDIQGLIGTPIRTDSNDLLDQNGGIIYNQLYAGRVIGISFSIFNTVSDDLFDSFNEVVNAFSLSPEDKELRITPWTSTTVTSVLNARVIQEPSTSLRSAEITHSSALFTQLYASDPNFKDGSDTVYGPITTAETTGFPLAAPLPMPLGSLSGGSFTINNIGDVTAYARFRIDGGIVNPTITNKATGESFSLDVNLGFNEYIDIEWIDGSLSVLRNGTQNARALFSGKFFEIAKGINTIVFDAVSGSGTLTAYYRNNYLTLLT